MVLFINYMYYNKLIVDYNLQPNAFNLYTLIELCIVKCQVRFFCYSIEGDTHIEQNRYGRTR